MRIAAESDIEAELFKLLRRTRACKKSACYSGRQQEICLVHSQWPYVKSKSPRITGSYDIVIWDKHSLPNPDSYWGIGSAERAKKILLDVVIEIKHRRNSLNPPDIWSKKDLEKLCRAIETGKTKRAYYLVFFDEDINDDKKKAKFEEIVYSLRHETEKYQRNLKIVCATRSGLKEHWIN